MIGYNTIESAVVERIIGTFPDELNSDVCKAGDFDAVLDNMFNSNNDYGCLVEFDGGFRMNNSPFDRLIWTWSMLGIFLVRYTGNQETEERMRDIVSKLATMFQDDFKLGGVTAIAHVSRVTTPDTAQINDIPFYWIPFQIDVIDR